MKVIDEFKFDIMMYERATNDPKIRCYSWLRERADAAITREKDRKVTEAIAAAYAAKAAGATGTPGLLAGPTNLPRSQQVCFSMRDRGSCSKGDKCEYSHDAKVIADAKAKVSSESSRGPSSRNATRSKSPGSRKGVCREWKEKGVCSRGIEKVLVSAPSC